MRPAAFTPVRLGRAATGFLSSQQPDEQPAAGSSSAEDSGDLVVEFAAIDVRDGLSPVGGRRFGLQRDLVMTLVSDQIERLAPGADEVVALQRKRGGCSRYECFAEPSTSFEIAVGDRVERRALLAPARRSEPA